VSGLTATTFADGYLYSSGGFVTTRTDAPVGSLSPTSRTSPAAGDSYSLTVTPIGGTGTWALTSKPAWVNLSASSGNGTTTITVTVTANNGAERTGGIIILGQSHSIRQYQAIGLSSTAAWTPPSAATTLSPARSVIASVGDSWTAVSSTPTWLTVSPSTPQTGTGAQQQLTVSVSANPNSTSRTGTITVGASSFTVTQAGAAVVVSLNQSSYLTAPTTAGNRNIILTATPSGFWSVSNKPAWLTVTPASGTNTGGTVNLAWDPNTATTSRTANLTFNGTPYTLTQVQVKRISSTATFETVAAATTTNRTVYATTGDTWTGSTTVGDSTTGAWLTLRIGSGPATSTISSSGQQTVTIVVAANTSNRRREATVTLAGFTFTVTQAYR
jgi:hypothetical protein